MRITEQAQRLMRAEHMSLRTEKAYLHWMNELFHFERNRCGCWIHPDSMGSDEINRRVAQVTCNLWGPEAMED